MLGPPGAQLSTVTADMRSRQRWAGPQALDFAWGGLWRRPVRHLCHRLGRSSLTTATTATATSPGWKTSGARGPTTATTLTSPHRYHRRRREHHRLGLQQAGESAPKPTPLTHRPAGLLARQQRGRHHHRHRPPRATKPNTPSPRGCSPPEPKPPVPPTPRPPPTPTTRHRRRSQATTAAGTAEAETTTTAYNEGGPEGSPTDIFSHTDA